MYLKRPPAGFKPARKQNDLPPKTIFLISQSVEAAAIDIMISMTAPSQSLASTLERMDYGLALKEALLMNGSVGSAAPYAQPLLDAISLFEQLKIKYALIGGIAAMYYGRARFTEDIDFVAASGHPDVLRSHPHEMEANGFDPSCTFKLYHRSGLQIDLWKDAFAEQIIDRALEVELAGRRVRIINPHDLIAMKLRAGRLKDDYDISQILSLQEIDDERIRELVTPTEFSQFQLIKKRR